MISILLMSVFAVSALNFRDGPKNTNTIEWSSSKPDVGTAGENAREFAAAAVTKKTGDRDRDAATACGYIAALENVRKAAAIIPEVTIGTEGNQFVISVFAKDAGLALVKFYKKVADGTRNLLACVIDIASTGKKDADITEAKDIQGRWLKRFYELIFDEDKISGDANTTAYTAVDDFASDPDTKAAFAALKGMVPRREAFLTPVEKDALAAVAQDKHNGTSVASEHQRKLATLLRDPEKYKLVLPLVILQKADINVSGVVSRLNEKVWELVERLDKVTPGTDAAFRSDDYPSPLQLDFWRVIWEETILTIVSGNHSQSYANELVNSSLAKLDKLAAQVLQALTRTGPRH